MRRITTRWERWWPMSSCFFLRFSPRSPASWSRTKRTSTATLGYHTNSLVRLCVQPIFIKGEASLQCQNLEPRGGVPGVIICRFYWYSIGAEYYLSCLLCPDCPYPIKFSLCSLPLLFRFTMPERDCPPVG